MLWRSLSRRPAYPTYKGEWDCWLICRPALFEEDPDPDLAASIGEATAALKVSSVITIQLGHRVVICHSTFLLPSIPICQAQILTGRLALATVQK